MWKLRVSKAMNFSVPFGVAQTISNWLTLVYNRSKPQSVHDTSEIRRKKYSHYTRLPPSAKLSQKLAWKHKAGVGSIKSLMKDHSGMPLHWRVAPQEVFDLDYHIFVSLISLLILTEACWPFKSTILSLTVMFMLSNTCKSSSFPALQKTSSPSTTPGGAYARNGKYWNELFDSSHVVT